jgi:transcriptional regulator with XRE-family HTH domain
MTAPTSRTAVRRAYGMTLRTLRKRIGLAQERLALEADADRAYMSGLERGLHTPTLETILRFLPHLKVSFPEFAAEYEKWLRKARREAKK